jgi:hypothetical protein
MRIRLSSAITIGAIARELKQPLHRIEYVLRTRNIEAVSTAGHVRIFDRDAVERVAAALSEIDARRGQGISCGP